MIDFAMCVCYIKHRGNLLERNGRTALYTRTQMSQMQAQTQECDTKNSPFVSIQRTAMLRISRVRRRRKRGMSSAPNARALSALT